MDIRIIPKRLNGSIEAVSSKSDAHRAIICAALADKPTRITLNRTSVDILTTAECMNALGASITFDEVGCTVVPIAHRPEKAHLHCNESGSTLRFLLPVAAAVCGCCSFSGAGRLPERPIGLLKEAMEAHGAQFDCNHLPLTVTGGMAGGEFSIPGNVSSQYISGLLMALPLLGGGSVRLTTALESAGYVDMTVSTMRRFGVNVSFDGTVYTVCGSYTSSGAYAVEGDWSNAAFWMAANALGSAVELTGLSPDSVQGDAAVAQRIGNLGGGKEIDLRQIPDALPAMAAAATGAAGETRFINGARLRIKESDRLATVAAMIKALGGIAEELPEGLIVRGSRLKGGTVDCVNDHRIAMAAAAAATVCEGPVTLLGAQAVEKSYPTFFEDYAKLGGKTHVL